MMYVCCVSKLPLIRMCMYVYTYCMVGQDEVEDTGLITDEPIENDSIAFYFCSPKVTANCEYHIVFYIHAYIHKCMLKCTYMYVQYVGKLENKHPFPTKSSL